MFLNLSLLFFSKFFNYNHYNISKEVKTIFNGAFNCIIIMLNNNKASEIIISNEQYRGTKLRIR